MMKDPIFVKQMKAMMGEKGVEEAAARAKSAFQEISNDPEKLAVMKSKMEKFMQGGESIRPDLSSGMRREVKRLGMSERKIGMKSARPSSSGLRSAAPVKNEMERNRPENSGAANGVSPAVCR